MDPLAMVVLIPTPPTSPLPVVLSLELMDPSTEFLAPQD